MGIRQALTPFSGPLEIFLFPGHLVGEAKISKWGIALPDK
jgi:hypothetical protein